MRKISGLTAALLLFFVSMSQGFAQDLRGVVRVGTREDIITKLPDSVAYLLPSFRDGIVVYKNGSTAGGCLNICLVDNSVRFINDRGDTLLLSNAETVDNVVLGDSSVIKRDGRFLLRKAICGKITLCEERTFTFTEPELESGYSGIPATSTAKAVSVRNLENSSRAYGSPTDIPWRLKTRYVLDDGTKPYIAKRQSFERVFPQSVKEIKAYVKSERTDFDDIDSLLDLFEYCARLAAASSSGETR